MTDQRADYGQVIPAYLGWGNAERDTANVRLYATDRDDSPRWASEPGGRVIEYAINGGEGDRFLVVRVGDRFTSKERMAELQRQIEALLAEPDA